MHRSPTSSITPPTQQQPPRVGSRAHCLFASSILCYLTVGAFALLIVLVTIFKVYTERALYRFSVASALQTLPASELNVNRPQQGKATEKDIRALHRPVVEDPAEIAKDKQRWPDRQLALASSSSSSQVLPTPPSWDEPPLEHTISHMFFLNPRMRCVDLPTGVKHLFIAANLHNSEEVLPQWLREMKRFLLFLNSCDKTEKELERDEVLSAFAAQHDKKNSDNNANKDKRRSSSTTTSYRASRVFISVFTNKCKDRTNEILVNNFVPWLREHGIPGEIRAGALVEDEFASKPDGMERIEWLSRVRNAAMQPLYRDGTRVFLVPEKVPQQDQQQDAPRAAAADMFFDESVVDSVSSLLSRSTVDTTSHHQHQDVQQEQHQQQQQHLSERNRRILATALVSAEIYQQRRNEDGGEKNGREQQQQQNAAAVDFNGAHRDREDDDNGKKNQAANNPDSPRHHVHVLDDIEERREAQEEIADAAPASVSPPRQVDQATLDRNKKLRKLHRLQRERLQNPLSALDPRMLLFPSSSAADHNHNVLPSIGETRVLFINDIVFTAEDMLLLLHTNGGGFDMACGMDYYFSFYDSWVARDIAGRPLWNLPPYSSERMLSNGVRNLKPVDVSCCWNGAVAARASVFIRNEPNNEAVEYAIDRFWWLYQQLLLLSAEDNKEQEQQQQQQQHEMLLLRDLAHKDILQYSINNGDNNNNKKTVIDRVKMQQQHPTVYDLVESIVTTYFVKNSFQPKIKFRMSCGECCVSECSLLCGDMHRYGYNKIVMNPLVRVAYDTDGYTMHRGMSFFTDYFFATAWLWANFNTQFHLFPSTDNNMTLARSARLDAVGGDVALFRLKEEQKLLRLHRASTKHSGLVITPHGRYDVLEGDADEMCFSAGSESHDVVEIVALQVGCFAALGLLFLAMLVAMVVRYVRFGILPVFLTRRFAMMLNMRSFVVDVRSSNSQDEEDVSVNHTSTSATAVRLSWWSLIGGEALFPTTAIAAGPVAAACCLRWLQWFCSCCFFCSSPSLPTKFRSSSAAAASPTSSSPFYTVVVEDDKSV